MYYDLVVSVYDGLARKDMKLICGSFKTEEEAMQYAYDNDIWSTNYEWMCKCGEFVGIDIEAHNEDGTLEEIIATNH